MNTNRKVIVAATLTALLTLAIIVLMVAIPSARTFVVDVVSVPIVYVWNMLSFVINSLFGWL